MFPLLIPLIFATTYAIDKQLQCSLLDGLWIEDPPHSCLIREQMEAFGPHAEGKKFCEARGGHLAHIKDQATLNQVISYLNESKRRSGYWIGLEAIDHGDKFNLSEWHWIGGAEGDPVESFRDESLMASFFNNNEITKAHLRGGIYTFEPFKLSNSMSAKEWMPALCQYPGGFDHCRLVSCMNGGSCVQNETRASCSCPDEVSGDNCEVLNAKYTLAYGDAAVQGSAETDTYGLTAVFIQEHLRPGTFLGWRISVGTGFLYVAEGIDLLLLKPTGTADNFRVVLKKSVKVYELNLHGGLTWIPAEPNITIDGQTLMGFHYDEDDYVLANVGSTVPGQPNLKVGFYEDELPEDGVLTLSYDMERKFALEVVVVSCPPGFTGHDCSIDINECESNPCGEHGDCVDKVNGYECVCKHNYMGAHCSCERRLEEKFYREKKDAYLVGTAGQSTTVRNHVLCAFRCNAVDWCQSFDFVHKNGTCLLNKERSGVLQDAPGIDHFVRERDCP